MLRPERIGDGGKARAGFLDDALEIDLILAVAFGNCGGAMVAGRDQPDFSRVTGPRVVREGRSNFLDHDLNFHKPGWIAPLRMT